MPIISKQFSNTQYRPAIQNRPVNNTQMLDTAQTSPFVHDMNSPPKPVPNLLPATNKYASGGLPQNVNYTNNPTNQPVRMPFMGMQPQGMNQDQMKAMMAHNMLARGVSNPYGILVFSHIKILSSNGSNWDGNGRISGNERSNSSEISANGCSSNAAAV